MISVLILLILLEFVLDWKFEINSILILEARQMLLSESTMLRLSKFVGQKLENLLIV